MSNSIQVRMLGGFSIMYDGEEVVLNSNSTLKYMLLLQLMLLKGAGNSQGLSKNQLVTALYEGADVSNSNNSVNNLLYQLRRQLSKAGLPGGDYIVRSGDRYVLSPELNVKVDAREFETDLKAAADEPDESRRILLYRKAFDLYGGELLPRANTEMWVIVESVRLERLYKECVEQLADYYRSQSDYTVLEHIYQRAAKACPCDRWEIGWIDTLVERGDYKQAYQAYDNMVRTYMEEMGGSPTPEMLLCYERIGEHMKHLPGRIETICAEIADYTEAGAEAWGGGIFAIIEVLWISVRFSTEIWSGQALRSFLWSAA